MERPYFKSAYLVNQQPSNTADVKNFISKFQHKHIPTINTCKYPQMVSYTELGPNAAEKKLNEILVPLHLINNAYFDCFIRYAKQDLTIYL
jgi:hypothetical protein